jgi:hypothetical protein
VKFHCIPSLWFIFYRLPKKQLFLSVSSLYVFSSWKIRFRIFVLQTNFEKIERNRLENPKGYTSTYCRLLCQSACFASSLDHFTFSKKTLAQCQKFLNTCTSMRFDKMPQETISFQVPFFSRKFLKWISKFPSECN